MAVDRGSVGPLELRKCPYCGSQATKFGSKPGWWAMCKNEDCGTKVFAAVDASLEVGSDAMHDAMYLVTARWNRLR